MGKAHRDKMARKIGGKLAPGPVNILSMDTDSSRRDAFSARLAARQKKLARKNQLFGGNSDNAMVELEVRRKAKPNKITNSDLKGNPSLLEKAAKATKDKRKKLAEQEAKEGIKPSKKVGITQKDRFFKASVKENVIKNIEAIEDILQHNPHWNPEANQSLLAWLYQQRKNFATGQIDTIVLDQLNDLSRFNFNWMHATFRWGPFNKSLAVRQTWVGEKRSKLTVDLWSKEQYKALLKGELPPKAAEGVKQLLQGLQL